MVPLSRVVLQVYEPFLPVSENNGIPEKHWVGNGVGSQDPKRILGHLPLITLLSRPLQHDSQNFTQSSRQIGWGGRLGLGSRTSLGINRVSRVNRRILSQRRN